MKVMELINIGKVYSSIDYKVEALKNVNIEVESGEMVGIVGTSGSGKTTLLNVMGLLDTADSGTYRLMDRDTASLKDRELANLRNTRLGFVMQDFALIDRYTVEQNVRLPLLYSNVPKKEQAGLIFDMLKQMRIEEKAKRYPHQLSGGQKQRVAIARALIAGAGIILADEPTGALDKRTSNEIMGVLAGIKESERTVIIVTHDPEIASRCDRVLNLEDGMIVR